MCCRVLKDGQQHSQPESLSKRLEIVSSLMKVCISCLRLVSYLREICEPLFKPGDATVELLKAQAFEVPEALQSQ